MSDILQLLVKVKIDIHEGPIGTDDWKFFEQIDAAGYVVGEFHGDDTVDLVNRTTLSEFDEWYKDIMEPGDIMGMIHWPADSVLCDLLLTSTDVEDM